MNNRIEIRIGDIAASETEVIVNAAKSSLLGGGGVDGAIHKAAGAELLEECRNLGGCMTGDAKITKGYKLKAKNVIHTVGPVWQGGDDNEESNLYSCYTESLKLCAENNLKSITFSCISTGNYNFPNKKAAEIAVKAVNDFLLNNQSIKKVVFCCYLEKDYKIYKNLLQPTLLNKCLNKLKFFK